MNIKISPHSIKTALPVIIQFICIGIIVYSIKLLPQNYFSAFLLYSSLILALWAMIIMKFYFNAAPEVLQGAKLRTAGPYRLIRHPMYTALIGLGVSWLIEEYSLFRFLIFIILFINQLIKLKIEERFLINEFEEYEEYMKSTKMLIPYLF